VHCWKRSGSNFWIYYLLITGGLSVNYLSFTVFDITFSSAHTWNRWQRSIFHYLVYMYIVLALFAHCSWLEVRLKKKRMGKGSVSSNSVNAQELVTIQLNFIMYVIYKYVRTTNTVANMASHLECQYSSLSVIQTILGQPLLSSSDPDTVPITGGGGDLRQSEISAFLGYYTASCGNCLPTFRDNVSVPSSRVKSQSRKERKPATYNLLQDWWCGWCAKSQSVFNSTAVRKWSHECHSSFSLLFCYYSETMATKAPLLLLLCTVGAVFRF
jgi:hypothetical protein